MSEKRFTFGVVSQNDVEIKDNGEPMNIGEVVDKLNEQQARIKELEKKNKELKIKYANRGIAIIKAVEDLYRKEEVYLADFDICKRITEYEWEFNNE